MRRLMILAVAIMLGHMGGAGALEGGPTLRAAPPGVAPTPPRRVHVPSVQPPAEGAGQQLPDLVPLPAWGVYVDESIISIGATDIVQSEVRRTDPYAGSKRAIRFGTTIANRGRHALEIIGTPAPTRDPNEPVRVNAMQCVRFVGPRFEGSGRACQTYEPVGSLAFHPEHGHFHINRFAQYRLLRDAGGRPDRNAIAGRSEKVGFCMGDTDWVGPAYDVALDTGWYRECRHTTPHVPVTLRQGVSPNWGDSYGPALAGQHIVTEHVPDGVYWIEITLNPPEYQRVVRIRETSWANNRSYRRIRLFGAGRQVEML